MGEMHGGGINPSCLQDISKQTKESVCMRKEWRYLQRDEAFQQECGSDDLINGQRCPVAASSVRVRGLSQPSSFLSAQLSVADPLLLRLSKQQLLEHLQHCTLHSIHHCISRQAKNTMLWACYIQG